MPSKKANKTSFKPGHGTWNKTGRFKTCSVCSNDFWITKKRDEQCPSACCSKPCADKLRTNPETSRSRQAICLRLAKEGLKLREIAEKTGFPLGSVGSYLNKAKYRLRPVEGQSYLSQRNRLKKLDEYKQCNICEFDRIVEIAHIIPASKGGDLSIENTLGLCPNHHHLFDHNKLTEDEYNKIKNKVEEIYAKRISPAV